MATNSEQQAAQDAEDIRAIRETAGLSRDALGEKVGRSGRTVEKWEQGLSRVPSWAWRLLDLQGLHRRRATGCQSCGGPLAYGAGKRTRFCEQCRRKKQGRRAELPCADE